MSGGGGGFMSGGGGGKGDISGVNHSPAAMLAASHAGHNPAALRPSPLAAAAAAQLALEQHQQQQHQHGRAAADALAVATLSAAGKSFVRLNSESAFVRSFISISSTNLLSLCTCKA